MAFSLARLARDACGRGAYAQGKRVYWESLAVFREIGYSAGAAMVLGDLGEVSTVLGEYVEATRLAHESLLMDEELGYPVQKAWAHRVLGNAACGLGDYQTARAHLRQALEQAMSVRATAPTLLTLAGIAALLARQGERERPVELLALVLRHPARLQWTADRAARILEELRSQLAPEQFAPAQERGEARDIDSTVNELLSELGDAPLCPSAEFGPR